ncbi:MAG TPA: hypothetical protein DCQ98_22750 [Planctomycetaceae bacterium]|nr:hypothetical protein [Planctomycetaceae bacterium]
MLYVLFVAILNLGLGAAFAVMVGRREARSDRRRGPARRSARRLSVDKPAAAASKKAESTPATPSGAAPAPPPPPEPFRLPADWAELIGSRDYFDAIEPSARLLHATARAGLDSLSRLADVVARLTDDQGDGPFAKLGNEIKGIVAEQRRPSQSMLDLFDEAGYQFGPLTPLAVRLESLVQGALQEWDELVERYERASEAEEGRNQAALRVHHDLARRLHTLRDEMDEIAVAAIVAAGRIEPSKFGEAPPGDGRIEGRLPLESTFAAWLADDPTRTRLLSFVLMDLDETDRFNRECGLELGDRLLQEVSKVLFAGIRNNRGFDRFYRISGQQFVMFLGDTSAKDGAFASERIRQSLSQTTFRLRNRPVEIRCTAAVTGLQKSDTCEHVIERLLRAVRKSKRSGLDQTVIVQDGKATNAEAKNYDMPARSVEIESAESSAESGSTAAAPGKA